MNTGNCVSPEFHVIEIQQAQLSEFYREIIIFIFEVWYLSSQATDIIHLYFSHN